MNKKGYQLFHTALLQTVTFEPHTFKGVYVFMMREPEAGSYIKHLRIDNSCEPDAGFEVAPIPGIRVTSQETFMKALRVMNDFVLSKLDNLQTYINRFPEIFELPLVETKSGRLKPLPYFQSITHLEVASSFRFDEGILARNLIWVLSFAPNLRSGIFTVLVSLEDSKILEEYAGTFNGLSNIKDIALRVRQIYDSVDSKTWWGLEENDRKTRLRFGSRKTDAVHDLLRVTKI